MQRRDVLRAALLAAGTALTPGAALASGEIEAEGAAIAVALADAFAAIEQKSGGRLGVSVRDVNRGFEAGYRQHERFALCSTFKLPLAAMILRAADEGTIDLDEQLEFGEDDMVPHAPVTRKNLERGYMTVAELAKAAQTTSDNVAANLLLGQIGGPEGFTTRLRELGDDVTRLDRYEPDMNLVPAGEVRDTTTPAAMARLVQLFFGGALAASDETQLRAWLEATQTGKRRLKAGLPKEWPVGNKTGTGIADGIPNKYNDVAIAWRPGMAGPLIIAAYFEANGEYPNIRPEDEDVLRAVAEVTALSV